MLEKISVEIGLIKSKTAVAILSCTVHIGNVRAKTKIIKIIRVQEKQVAIDHGRDWKGKETCTEKPTI